MASFVSKLTSQGQTSVPVEVRRQLGITPGEALEWVEESGQFFVRRKTLYSWEDMHRELHSEGPPQAHSLEELNAGKARAVRARHALR
jgi:bifunctional DNA-binding transcriptional regulator/antitoxin component of YhaV-PrlF toxin-antitoxin module